MHILCHGFAATSIDGNTSSLLTAYIYGIYDRRCDFSTKNGILDKIKYFLNMNISSWRQLKKKRNSEIYI